RTSLGWLARAAHLRFAAFVRRPEPTWAYARAALARREARHLGHNPLGGWMILALLGAALIAGASGALYATDAFWGDPTLYALHQVSGWSFALLIPLHVGGVVLTSILQRENLIAAMVTGRKRAPAPGDTGLG
ncbi:MAG: cytochrome b/b6 domain-containing protein, partial [Burkholderiaceae bacterium]